MTTESAGIVEVLGCSARAFAVQGHHYALVTVTGLTPDCVTEYDVKVDGALVWPQEFAAPAERHPHPRAGVDSPATGDLRIVPISQDRR